MSSSTDEPPIHLATPHPSHDCHTLVGALKLASDYKISLSDLIFINHGLIGRGTCVATAEPTEGGVEWKRKKLFCESSFKITTKTRSPERVVLVSNVMKQVGERKEDKWVLDHLPELRHYERLAPTASDVQTQVLSAHFMEKSFSNVYGNRVLQVMITTEQFPITELTTPETLITATRDVFKCYRWLYETAGIMHQDIGLNNVMFRRKDGHIHGVLIDYDLVLELQKRDLGPSSKNRTGSRLYIALDLLDTPPMAHQYRHDLESLYYVLVVLTTGYKNSSLIEDWRDADAKNKSSALYENKFVFIHMHLIPPLSTPFQKLEDIIEGLGLLFQLGYRAQCDARRNARKALQKNLPLPLFNEVTLGGHVDFDEFEAILSQPIDA